MLAIQVTLMSALLGSTSWLGPEQNLGGIGSIYNLTMDHFEKYDMVSSRMPMQSPGKCAGQDNGWVFAVIVSTVMEFNKSIVDYPSIARVRWRRLNRLAARLSKPG